MRILLQHARTQLYLRSLGNWTASAREAYDFQHSQRAIDFADENGITGVHIVVNFVHEDSDEVLEIPARAGESVRT